MGLSGNKVSKTRSNQQRQLFRYAPEAGKLPAGAGGFRKILISVDPFYHKKMSIILQLAVAANEPLQAGMYAFHKMEYDNEDYVLQLSSEEFDYSELGSLLADTTYHLNSRTQGLLEVSSGYVQFLHRTVQDFLETREMSELLTTLAGTQYHPFISLLRAYTALLKRHRWKGLDGDSILWNGTECIVYDIKPFAERVIKCAEELPYGIQVRTVLDEFDRVIAVQKLRNVALPPEIETQFSFAKLVVQRELLSYLYEKTQRRLKLSLADPRPCPADSLSRSGSEDY